MALASCSRSVPVQVVLSPCRMYQFGSMTEDPSAFLFSNRNSWYPLTGLSDKIRFIWSPCFGLPVRQENSLFWGILSRRSSLLLNPFRHDHRAAEFSAYHRKQGDKRGDQCWLETSVVPVSDVFCVD